MTYSDVTVEELDKGKRASDIINAIITSHDWDDIKDRFIAIRLSDGGSDSNIYDTKLDAVQHQIYEQQCCYIAFRSLGMGGVTPKECAIFIKFNADAYAKGMRLVDPDNRNAPAQDLIIPASGFDRLRNNMNQRLLAAAARRAR